MTSTFHFLPLCTLLFLIISPSSLAQTSFRPKALVLPISKDASSLQYIAQLNQRTPLVPIKLTLDLGGQFLWVDCEQHYASSTYKPIRCHSAQCSLANGNGCGECYSSPKPGCNNNTCSQFPDNTVTHTATGGELAQDVVSIQSTNGLNPGRVVSVSSFIFTCGSTFLLKGLASGVKGMAGLGRTRISVPSQFSTAFSFHRKFAICLSSSTSFNGVMFFGDGPYVLLPNNDVSKSLIYTPLIKNPVSTASAYTQGFGGTKISTVNPYTIMETSIYNAVLKAFIKELANVPRVASVAPFGACFSSKNIGSTRVGPAVPQIDFVLQSESVFWTVFGSNSMVQVSKDVLCLGFVDGGSNPRTSIVIGGYQIEDNLLQFDLATSRLGFSSSLSFQRTTCANFNFTANA
ncbi:hypothetical protein CMV_013015 [Castanea mollissima]|uniref:Peptidase A1 domain-containing protein n=1 Tax=Castanea mollissima TaxID=60419 RepID=A0A8J4RDR9_9ROSI|nr:hypothetical protein CMV_013015 [Castanea mollissima]